MFICTKCTKEFKYESELNRHNDRKTECNKIKDNLKCDICNTSFVRPSHKIAHDKTKKHINNYNKCNIQKNNFIVINILYNIQITNDNK